MSRPLGALGGNAPRMERKPVLMPPALIAHTEALARQASEDESRSVSFAEIVRRALMEYQPQAAGEDEALLEALADALIQSTRETNAYLEQVERKLDATHAELERHRHGAE